MGREAACMWGLPFVLSVVFAMGCTTRVINLSLNDGGAKDASVAAEDTSVVREDADGASATDINLAADNGGTEDAGVDREDASVDPDVADDASSTHFKEAYDAGWVNDTAHYVEFTCCTVGDAPTCTETRLGGPDVCRSPSEWKSLADNHCTSMNLNFTAYGPFGACANMDAR